MCLAVYIGLDKPQQTGKWVEGETLLYFEELSEHDVVIKEKFSKDYIYYVGADTGCSCGFDFNSQFFNDPEEEVNKKSPQKLIDFITSQTKEGEVELYCCWEGDWSDPVQEVIAINITQIKLSDNYFGMKEKRLILFPQCA